MQLKNGYIYWQTGEDIQFTTNFHSREFECPEPDATNTHKISMELVSLLQIARDECGFAIKINSGYRTTAYQAKLRAKGYQTAKGISQHELGNAADPAPVEDNIVGDNMEELENILDHLFESIGFANTFTHVDTRRDKHRSWSYGNK